MDIKSLLKQFSFAPREAFARLHTMLIIPFSYIVRGIGDTSGSLPTNAIGDAVFIGKILAANAVTATVQSTSLTLEALVAEALFVTGNMWYYKFLINPTNLRISNSKLQSIDETSDITIINTYRNTSPVFSFSGVSGCTLPRDFMKITNSDTKLPTETFARYPKLSTAWLKFRQLEKFYNEVNTDIVIMYDMDIYVGKFVNFSYTQDANNPWIINYDLQIRMYPGLSLHTMSAYDYSTFFDSVRERYGMSFAQDFEGKSKLALNETETGTA